MPDFTPKPEHKFTFGLWTVGSTGREPFGGPVREALNPAELVRRLGDVVAYGINFMHGVSREAGKLFHIDLNDQYPGRYDQDLRFGSRDLKAPSISSSSSQMLNTMARVSSTPTLTAPKLSRASRMLLEVACALIFS